MPGANNRAIRELQAVKTRSNANVEVCYSQELRYIQEMRKHLVHNLPQVFATTESPIVSDMTPVIKVKPTDPVKEKLEPISEHSNGRDKSQSASAAPDSISKTLLFLVVLATYLLGFGSLFLGIVLLCDPIILENSWTVTNLIAWLVSPVTNLIALLVGRIHVGTGLAMLILVCQRHLRTLGTLLLCEAVAEIVMMVPARNSGLEIDALMGTSMMGVPMTGKVVLGVWLVNSRG